MKYHCGICIKECEWKRNQYSYIVVLAGNENEDKFSLFVKIIEKEECANINAIKYGNAVFFLSDGDNIVDIYNIDEMFSSRIGTRIKHKEIHLRYSPTLEGLRVEIENRVIKVNKKENELMRALYKGRLYNEHFSSIPKVTAESVQSIIKEEEEFVESCNIEDMLNELSVSYHAYDFYIKTDEPEEYKLSEKRSFKNTKYENFILDTYLFQLIEPGDWFIEEYKGWFFAKEEAKDKVEYKNSSINWLKEQIKRRYSKSEHLNYRVRERLLEYIHPLFRLSEISGRIIDLNNESLRRGTLRYYTCWNNEEYFSFNEFDNKEVILSKVRLCPVDKLVNEISKSIDSSLMAREWKIPYPKCTKETENIHRNDRFWK